MNSPENFAAALAVGFDIGLPGAAAPFAAGLSAIGSSNFSGASILELSALLRRHFGRGAAMREGWFAQANIGGSIIRADLGSPPALVAEARAGFRQPMGAGLFIEPYARIGFPVLLGVGAVGGVRFPAAGGQAGAWRGAAGRGAAGRAAPSSEALAVEIAAALEGHDLADTFVYATDEGVVISLQNINFLPDSADLHDGELGKIHEIAALLRAMPEARIRIEGHTALAGAEEDRLRLSVERAENIAARLVGLGAVRAGNVSTAGHGAERPIAGNDTPEGMAANRRIEITILED